MVKFATKINGVRCKGCELCIIACPKGIIKIDDVTINAKGYYPAYVTEQEKCIGCANCAMVCPDGAIKIYGHEEGGGQA